MQQPAVLAKLAAALKFARHLVRWDEWYDGKIPLFLVCMYYAGLSRARLDARLLAEMALLLFLLCAYASFGHMANDFSDRAADRAAGKRNMLATLPEPRARMLVLVAGMSGLFPATLFYADRPVVIAVIAAAYALAALYSFPPARLKERGTLGVTAAAVAQRTLPALIVFAALGVWDWTAIAICVLSTLVGLRYILVHQLRDAHNDARAGTRTFATQRGTESLSRLVARVVFPLELASLGTAILTMGVTVPSAWVLAGVYAGWLEVQRRRLKRLGWSLSPISYGLLFEFYCVYWPLLLALVLSVREPLFLVVLAFTMAWLFRTAWILTGNSARLFASAAGARSEAALAAPGSHGAVTTAFPAVRSGDPASREVHRNEPCPCGSGKRYKHCHGRLA